MPVVINGTNGANYLFDQPMGTTVLAGGGNDVIIAHANDVFLAPQPGGGALPVFELDVFNGGSGFDTVSYASASTSIWADLKTGVASRWASGAYAPDSLVSIESVIGGAHKDWLLASDAGNHLNGLGGDDELYGGNGDDTLYGGTGDDQIWGGANQDVMFGETGDDSLYGGNGNDSIDGNGGGDLIAGGFGFDTLNGGDNNDVIHGDAGDDVIDGGKGADTLYGGHDDDDIHGGDGADRIDAGLGDDTVEGGAGVDTIAFTTPHDVTVVLFQGYSAGQTGDKSLSSIENIVSDVGDDYLAGASGNNRIEARAGDDIVYGLGGDDLVYGGDGDDDIDGGSGDDDLRGGADHDEIEGAGGDDAIRGDGGNDTLSGGADDDVLSGGSGDDWLRGGGGDDELDGGSGHDRLDGGSGFNAIATGGGKDVIAYVAGQVGFNTVSDFDVAQDSFDFGPGVLVGGAGTELSDVLYALESFSDPADSFLVANVVGQGWRSVALLEGVDAGTLEAMIDDGSLLFQPSLNPGIGGGPGGFETI